MVTGKALRRIRQRQTGDAGAPVVVRFLRSQPHRTHTVEYVRSAQIDRKDHRLFSRPAVAGRRGSSVTASAGRHPRAAARDAAGRVGPGYELVPRVVLVSPDDVVPEPLVVLLVVEELVVPLDEVVELDVVLP